MRLSIKKTFRVYEYRNFDRKHFSNRTFPRVFPFLSVIDHIETKKPRMVLNTIHFVSRFSTLNIDSQFSYFQSGQLSINTFRVNSIKIATHIDTYRLNVKWTCVSFRNYLIASRLPFIAVRTLLSFKYPYFVLVIA